LTCTTPSLWIIHVETANRKLYRLADNKLNARATASSKQYYHINSTLSSNDSERLHRVLPATTPLILSTGHIDCHDKVKLIQKIFHKKKFLLFYLGMVLYGRTTLA
jgi:hypothetical protein